MKAAVLAPAITLLVAPSLGAAEPRWRAEVPMRAVASVELDGMAPHARDGLVPASGVRVLRRLGPLQLGVMLGTGLPAWYGKAEIAGSIDVEHVLARPRCALVFDEPGDVVGRRACSGARWSLSGGFDAGAGLYYFDAPPETPPSSDALIYGGPLARARVQLHALQVQSNGRAVGIAVGASIAASSAHYMATAEGRGLRVEPELEVALTTRL